MRWLLFLSRLALICGMFFVVSFTLLVKNWLNDPMLESSVITIGYVMGLIILPVTNLCYLLVLLFRKNIRKYIPLWLILANVLFLLFMVYFIFYLNDPYYHQK